MSAGAAPRDADLPPGSRIGAHVVSATIARGGFGTVYAGVDERTGEPVAIKVLHAEIAASPEAVLRLEREAEVMRALDHPNVLAVRELGVLADGRAYLATELLHGRDLEQAVREGGRMRVGDALDVLAPLALALDAAHARGVVHRDVKASNVFLDEREGRRRVVLLDFGVAKLLDPSAESLTSSRQLVGTPVCMAPEQIRGQAPDARADVYALGALAFYLMSGELPFRGDSALAAQQLHLFARVPALSARAPVDAALDAVIARAMSKDRTRRQDSAGRLVDELRAAAGLGAPAAEPAIGVHVEIVVAGGLDDPDPVLLDDLERIFPIARAALGEAGLEIALETGHTLLAVSRGGASRDERARALDAAIALDVALSARPGGDARVAVAIRVHAGSGVLDAASWAPEPAAPGVAATAAALDGVERAGVRRL